MKFTSFPEVATEKHEIRDSPQFLFFHLTTPFLSIRKRVTTENVIGQTCVDVVVVAFVVVVVVAFAVIVAVVSR
jgi:hypothetical protein